MGIEYNAARLIASSRADFRTTLMVGRQVVVASNRKLTQLGLERCAGQYAERLFQGLGAWTVDSVDASGYEGASIVHDLNRPFAVAGSKHYERYSAVVDCGTLEHVFDFPTAIKGLMDALRPGGTFLLQTPTNNYGGHGFYQFSPELFYRLFSPRNGFRVVRMYMVQHLFEYHFFKAKWRPMPDPRGARRTFVTKHPALLLVQAQKFRTVPLSMIQQSDYEKEWKEKAPPLPRINEWLNRVYDLPLRLAEKFIRTRYE